MPKRSAKSASQSVPSNNNGGDIIDPDTIRNFSQQFLACEQKLTPKSRVSVFMRISFNTGAEIDTLIARIRNQELKEDEQRRMDAQIELKVEAKKQMDAYFRKRILPLLQLENEDDIAPESSSTSSRATLKLFVNFLFHSSFFHNLEFSQALQHVLQVQPRHWQQLQVPCLQVGCQWV
jgi:hypothetical protein